MACVSSCLNMDILTKEWHAVCALLKIRLVQIVDMANAGLSIVKVCLVQLKGGATDVSGDFIKQFIAYTS